MNLKVWWAVTSFNLDYWMLSHVPYWYKFKYWLLEILYCHHNARVLDDMSYRFGCVLTMCTAGMSKTNYTLAAMEAEINDFHNKMCDEAITDWCIDYGVDRTFEEENRSFEEEK